LNSIRTPGNAPVLAGAQLFWGFPSHKHFSRPRPPRPSWAYRKNPDAALAECLDTIAQKMGIRIWGGAPMKDPTITDLVSGVGTAVLAGITMLTALLLPFLALLALIQRG
jgi:hypothetical protein